MYRYLHEDFLFKVLKFRFPRKNLSFWVHLGSRSRFRIRFCLIFLCCGCARLSTKRTGQCAAWTMRSPSFCSRASAANGPGPGRSSLRWDPTSGSAPPDTSRWRKIIITEHPAQNRPFCNFSELILYCLLCSLTWIIILYICFLFST